MTLWVPVSRFKYRIKVAPGRFELGATPCPTHVGGHLDQLWNSNKSCLSISLRVQVSRFEFFFIVSIAFLRLKNTIATKKKNSVDWRKHVHISGNHPQGKSCI